MTFLNKEILCFYEEENENDILVRNKKGSVFYKWQMNWFIRILFCLNLDVPDKFLYYICRFYTEWVRIFLLLLSLYLIYNICWSIWYTLILNTLFLVVKKYLPEVLCIVVWITYHLSYHKGNIITLQWILLFKNLYYISTKK